MTEQNRGSLPPVTYVIVRCDRGGHGLRPPKMPAPLNRGSFNPWPTGQAGISPISGDAVSLTLLDATTSEALWYRLPGLTALSFPALKIAHAIEAGVRPGLSATG